MENRDPDGALRKLIAEAMVPHELCPRTIEEVEALLEMVDAKPFGDEQEKRILAKARGEMPIGERSTGYWAEEEGALSEREQELVALCRSQGKEIPPEIQKKLEEFRKKVRGEKRGNSHEAR